MLRTFALGLATAALLTSSAMAADLEMSEPATVVAVPSFSWTGAYVGAQAGYGWGDSTAMKPKGALVGAFAGYNVQLDNSPLVLGVETDFNWSDQDDTSGFSLVFLNFRVKEEVKWAGATRGRVGFAFDRVLVYGAAGVAYARRKLSASLSGPFVPATSASDTKTAIGWTVGGGADIAVTDQVIARVDYRYSDYGSDRFSGVGRSELTEHRLMGGVAYKF